MTAYHDGRRIEYAVAHDLEANGYRVTRAASSKGFADIIAIKPGEILFVNVKRTKMPGLRERAQLYNDAYPHAVPIVALKPLRQPLEYRRLTSIGPKDWEPWTPDQIGRPIQES